MGADMSKEELDEVFEDFFPATDYDTEEYHEMTEEEYEIYYSAIEKSRGYSVPTFPKALHIGISVPVNLNGSWRDAVYDCAKYAVEMQNKEKGTNYSFIDVVSAVLEPSSGATFYITFRVEDQPEVVEDMSQVGEVGNAIDGENLPRDSGIGTDIDAENPPQDSEMGNVVAAEDPAEVDGRGNDVVPTEFFVVDGGVSKKVCRRGGPILEVKAKVYRSLPKQGKFEMEVEEFLDDSSPSH